MKTKNTLQAQISIAAIILAIALFAAFVSSCQKEENTGPQKGCSIGISKTTGQLELLRCCTKEEWLAGNNVDAGGVSYFSSYTNHQWIKVSDCSKCDKY